MTRLHELRENGVLDRLITDQTNDQLTDPTADQTGLLPLPASTHRRPTRTLATPTLATRTAFTKEEALLPCPR